LSAAHLTLALVGHTNVGKTTLARTLLQRDVGEVLDRGHVTTTTERHEWLRSDAGDTLALLDTPGLADAAALLQRLSQTGWRRWLQREVSDRLQAPPNGPTEQALQTLAGQADALLYIVNAAELPQDSAHLQPELALLRWLDKPTLVLLNQLGPAGPQGHDAAELQRWQAALADCAFVHAVLPLDAFCRGPADEAALLQALPAALPAQARALQRLAAAWQARSDQRRDASQYQLSTLLADLAQLAEPLAAAPSSSWRDGLARAVGRGANRQNDAGEEALQRLLLKVEALVQANTSELLALHSLAGLPTRKGETSATSVAAALVAQVRERLMRQERPVDGKKLGLWGGVLSGAATGLGADLAAGGLTLGAGALIGAVVGALGGAGLAHGFNLYTGQNGQPARVRLSDDALQELFVAGLLRHRAVTHFGRGRGPYAEGAMPAHWLPAAQAAAAPQAEALKAVWPTLRGESAATELPVALKRLQQLHGAAEDRFDAAGLAARGDSVIG